MASDNRLLLGLKVDTPNGLGTIVAIEGDYVFINVQGFTYHYDFGDILFANGLRPREPIRREAEPEPPTEPTYDGPQLPGRPWRQR